MKEFKGFSKEKLKTIADTVGNVTKTAVANIGDATRTAAVSVAENVKESSEQFSKQMDQKKFEITTQDVVIKVNPERSDLIETRVIGGVKYIMICADESVEVNGVEINIKEEEYALP